MFTIYYHSNDKLIGFLGKEEFQDIESLVTHLLTFDPVARYAKNQYGYQTICWMTEHGEDDKMPAVGMQLIHELIRAYQELEEDSTTERRITAERSGSMARDFGRG